MEKYDETYEGLDVVEYKPYLQDGAKHSATARDLNNTYWQAFYGAFQGRFAKEDEVSAESSVYNVPAIIEEVVEVEEAPAAVVAPCACKKSKNFGAIAVGFVASILAIALAIISYFQIGFPYTSYFFDIGTRAIYDTAFGVITGSLSGMMVHGFVACFLVAGITIVVSFVLGIAALASKKKIYGVGILALIALIAALGSGALYYFISGVGTETAAIVDYINPLKDSTGVQWGFYIGVALLIIETICGFASNKKN